MYLNYEKTRNIATPSRLGHPAPMPQNAHISFGFELAMGWGEGVARVIPLNVFFPFNFKQIVNTR